MRRTTKHQSFTRDPVVEAEMLPEAVKVVMVVAIEEPKTSSRASTDNLHLNLMMSYLTPTSFLGL